MIIGALCLRLAPGFGAGVRGYFFKLPDHGKCGPTFDDRIWYKIKWEKIGFLAAGLGRYSKANQIIAVLTERQRR